MKDLTVIIPVHEYDESVKVLLDKAVESFVNANTNNEAILMFVGPKKVVTAIKKDYPGNKYVTSEKTSFTTMINAAVDSCKTFYFSILEFDDVFTEKWFYNVEKQILTGENISVYLPLTEVIDFKTKETIGYSNEAVWASSFSEEIGYLDIEALQNYMGFTTSGGVFKTDDFKDVGMLKESMELTFWQEFLLRAMHNGKKIYVIPKVGYNHTAYRENSITDKYSKTLKPEEVDFWVDMAKKEYFFKKDRNKSFDD